MGRRQNRDSWDPASAGLIRRKADPTPIRLQAAPTRLLRSARPRQVRTRQAPAGGPRNALFWINTASPATTIEEDGESSLKTSTWPRSAHGNCGKRSSGNFAPASCRLRTCRGRPGGVRGAHGLARSEVDRRRQPAIPAQRCSIVSTAPNTPMPSATCSTSKSMSRRCCRRTIRPEASTTSPAR